MDITALTQLIGSVGFPIVCCGYLMITFNKTISENTKSMNELCKLINTLLVKDSKDE